MSWLPTWEQLDPQQKQFIKDLEEKLKEKKTISPVWIKGFPGSGKSVLLVYAIKTILKYEPKAKILMVTFTRSLVDLFEKSFKDIGLIKDGTKNNIKVVTIYECEKGGRADYVLCDEVQDLSATLIERMKQKATKGLFVAGDVNQSIYEEEPCHREPTVNPTEILTIINGEDVDLVYIHRLTPSIIKAVQKMMPELNIFNAKRDMTKKDVQIRLCDAQQDKSEIEYIMSQAIEQVNQSYSSVILFPTANLVLDFCDQVLDMNNKSRWPRMKDTYYRPYFKNLNEYLKEQGIPLEYVGNGYGSLDSVDKEKHIAMMTYYSAKGLDFENVFIPFANEGLFIHDNPEKALTLFMVAMTRSKNNLYITYRGKPLQYVSSFSEERSICTKIKKIISNEMEIDF